MVKGSERKKVMVGVLCMLVAYLVTMGLLFTQGPAERSGFLGIITIVFLLIVLQWAIVIWGVWKGSYWAGGKFLVMFLLHNLKMFVVLFVLSSEIPWFLLTAPAALLFSYYSIYHLAKIEKGYWSPKPKWWKRILRIDTLPNLLLLLFIVEISLAIAGMKPGEIFPMRHFEQVSHLIHKQDYTNNADGIMVINSEGQKLAATGFWDGEFKEAYGADSAFSGSVHSVYRYYKRLRDGEEQSRYSQMIDSLKMLPDSLLSSVDSALIQTLTFPINKDGFRSIPFQPFETSKKKVLLLGDSFTFGWSADGWTNSFADLLSTKGYVVYNSGISGTDPAQYLAVAMKYIPLLQPDVVIVNIYLGNDVVYYPREVSERQSVYYVTNAGVLMACPTSECFSSPEEAYTFYLKEHYLAADSNSKPSEKFLSRTILGTAMWKGLKHLGILDKTGLAPHHAYWQRNSKLKSEKPLTEYYVQEIQKLCDSNGIPLINAIIPDLSNPQPDLESDFPGLFEVIPYHIPLVTAEDYVAGLDGHYNNLGHQKHAEFLDSLIRSIPALKQ